MPITLESAKEQQLRTELVKVEQQGAIKISDQGTYDHAAQALLTIKGWRKSWKSYWYGSDDNPGPVTLAHQSWKSLLGKFNEGDGPAEKAERALGREILRWDEEQRLLQEKLQREAQEKAEREAEAVRAQQAFEMEDAGASDAEIESLMEQPNLAIAEPVQQTYVPAAGISRRENWCIEISDLKGLLKAIGAGKFKLSAEDSNKLKEFMEGLLKPHAVAMKTTLNIPGCTAKNKPVLAGRVR